MVFSHVKNALLYLLDKLSLLLLSHLIASLEVPVELGLQSLHVDLQAQLGIFSRLQFVLQFLQLGFHLVYLGLQASFGLFQFVDLAVGGEGVEKMIACFKLQFVIKLTVILLCYYHILN